MATRTGRELSGLAVVTLSGGERMGRVDDVVFLPATGRVTGLMVDRGGMFSKPKFLPAGQIQSIGADAVTVTGEDALLEGDSNSPQSDPAEQTAKSLDGRPVLNQSGTVIGKVADVAVETESLTIPALVIATGLLDNALHGRPLLPLSLVQTIGADSVIASNDYDPKSPPAHP